MRARAAVTAFTATVVAAGALSACGSGSGSGGPATIPPASRTGATSGTGTAAPTSTAGSQQGAPLKLDPAVALPKDVTVVFDWTMPKDPVQNAALNATADFLQSIDHAIVRQTTQDPPLHAHAGGDALSYAVDFVQRNVASGLTLTGTDRFFRPVFDNGKAAKGSSRTSVEIRLCDNQSRIFSKETATGKVHVTGESDRNYVLFDIVVVKLPAAHSYWQAQGITVKEGALQCKQ